MFLCMKEAEPMMLQSMIPGLVEVKVVVVEAH